MWIKRLFTWVKEAEGLHGLATWDPLKTYVYPILAPGVTAVLGLLGDIPLMWIFVAAMASFAFVAAGLLRLDEWQTRVNPLGKLVFDYPFLELNAVRNGKTNEAGELIEVPFLVGGVPAFHLTNNAPYPIDFYITRINSSLQGRICTHPSYTNRGFTVNAGQSAFFRDNFIQVDAEITNQPVVAITEVEIDYWRKPTNRRKLHLKVRQVASIDPESGEVIAGRWEFDAESKNLVHVGSSEPNLAGVHGS